MPPTSINIFTRILTETQKAKTENKYYAAMRAKEAVDVERKAQSRHVEKQAKAIERLVDSERNLIAQVVRTGLRCGDTGLIDDFHQGDWEKEVVQWKRRAESGEFKAEKLDRENVELKHVKAIADFFTEKVFSKTACSRLARLFCPVRLVQGSPSRAREAIGQETI
jgi:hypothetical protein